jgi:hypothetical protein
MLINRTSLSQTVDSINAAQFDGRALAATERSQVARWIAVRQGLSGSYGGTFAGFPPNARGGLFCLPASASRRLRHVTSSARKLRAR